MSKSYRRPYCTHGQKHPKSKQFFKKQASKRIRNSEDVADGRSYRKLYDRWNIDDYKFFQSPSDIEKHWPEWWKLLRK